MKKLFVIDEKYHGRGPVLFAWQSEGNFLATAGSNGLVHIFDRHGEQIDEIALSAVGPCIALDWDKDGENLAVLQQNNGVVPIWNLSTRSVTMLETNLKDPTFLKWSKVGTQLAIGTGKGNLLIYRQDTRRKIPVLGKHTKAIISGAWSYDNILALGSEDFTLTLSKPSGDTIEHTNLKSKAVDIQFAVQKTDKGDDRESKKRTAEDKMTETTVSINMEGQTILLYNLSSHEEPIELKFQKRYGDIVTYKWFGDGYMILGFSQGYVVIISTHMKEIGQEIFSWRLFDESLYDICFCPVLHRAAACGDDCLKIIENVGNAWRQVKSESVRFDRKREGQIHNVTWTEDGQILTVGTLLGRVYNFVATMPMVHDCHGTRMAYLSSLQEISVVNISRRSLPVIIPVEVEPAFVALGDNHVAVGMNNRVWFYNCVQGNCELNNEREYLGTVEQVKLGNDCAAVLCDRQVHLHLVEPRAHLDHETKIFPDRNDKATCMALTADFLIYGTASGALQFFSLADWCPLSGCEFRHTNGIAKVWPNDVGTRCIFQDTTGAGFMYNPVDSSVLPIQGVTSDVTNILWDSADWGVFVTATKDQLSTYIYSLMTINGTQISKLGPMKIESNGDMSMTAVSTRILDTFVPVLVQNGKVTGQLKNGSVERLTLKTHADVAPVQSLSSNANLPRCFAQNLALLRLKDAWAVAMMLRNRAYWLALSGKAMEQLDIDMAIRVYRQLGDAGMVMALNKVRMLEDRNLLAGHVALLFSDYSQAQELFLRSGTPTAALEMRRDLLQWDHAMKLAKTLAPAQVPEISIKYAQQLEFKGDYSPALSMYQSAANSGGEHELSPTQLQQCRAGIARCTLRMGDIRRGCQLARDSGDRQLCRECASILESMKQWMDAATLFEKGENFEQAASIYIMTKNFAQAAPLMEKIRTPKLHAQYAKAKEAQKDYNEAVRAYERAHDMDSVVRLLLDPLQQAQRAFDIVRQTHSANAAQMVARYCQSIGDYPGAIEFLLMAKRSKDAFELAKKHDEGMDVYVDSLKENGTHEEYIQIARYYDDRENWGKAGHFYSVCGQYHKALKFFLKCGEREMDKAIALVGEARSDMLTHTLIDFLMGESDGVPKDPNYIFRLYMALGNYPQAAKTAIIIARQEQDLGNYRMAHQILYQTQRELTGVNMRVPKALRNAFLLLHSYLVVRAMAKRGEHLNAAHMLIRVAKNISKFPVHKVPILTSTVIECQRGGLKKSAKEYATMLMRSEHRNDINAKFKKKIEAIVRKYKKVKQPEEEKTPSPFDPDVLVPLTELVCPSTKNDMPWCIVSGYHMVKDDWCICPNSKLPALYSKYCKYLEKESVDPVCGEPVMKEGLIRVDDPTPYLEAWNQSAKEDGDDEGA